MREAALTNCPSLLGRQGISPQQAKYEILVEGELRHSNW